MSALSTYEQRVDTTNSLVCVGLDSDIHKIPPRFLQEKYPQFAFNTWIIEQTHPYVSAYKPNVAFYEARGEVGIHELKLTMEYLATTHPDIFTIADSKRADIGSTNQGYVESIFDVFGFDAVTLHPYLGREALEPFLSREDKVSIILCRTSNPGAGELQDLQVSGNGSQIVPLWKYIATKVVSEWNTKGNCMLVVGATYPTEMKAIRELVGEMTFLIPGIGAQGGDLKQTVHAGQNASGRGMMINSSRGIIFAPDPGKEAATLMEAINTFLE